MSLKNLGFFMCMALQGNSFFSFQLVWKAAFISYIFNNDY